MSKIVDKVKADPDNFAKSKAYEDLMKDLNLDQS